MMATRLDTLNNDVLEMIISKLTVAELSNLCLVNESLRCFVEPFLYASIEWTWMPNRTPSIQALLRTIFVRPELAAYIRSISLEGFSVDEPFDGEQSPQLQGNDDLDIALITEYIKSLSVSFEDSWISELKAGSMDALISLLISKTSRIRRLNLEDNSTRDIGLLGALLAASTYETPRNEHVPQFQDLEEVQLETTFRRESIRGAYTSDLLPFFYLPKLEQLQIGLDNPVKLEWPKTVPDLSQLKILHLTQLREAHLAQLLSLTTALEEFKFEIFFFPWDEHETNRAIIDLGLIASSLQCVRHTLRDLSITIRPTFRREPSCEYATVSFVEDPTGLRNLTKLHSLSIPLMFIIDDYHLQPTISLDKFMPTSLTQLSLDYDFACEETFTANGSVDESKLLQAVKTLLEDQPLPKTTKVSFNIATGGDTENFKEQVENMNAQLPVAFEVYKDTRIVDRTAND